MHVARVVLNESGTDSSLHKCASVRQKSSLHVRGGVTPNFIETFYNPVKRHSHTGGVSPAKFEEAYIARLGGV